MLASRKCQKIYNYYNNTQANNFIGEEGDEEDGEKKKKKIVL